MLRDTISHQLTEQLKLLTLIQSGQSNSEGLLQHQPSSSNSQTLVRNEGNTTKCGLSTVLQIRAHTIRQRCWCKPSCTCSCHNIKTMQSPKFFQKVTGVLFVGYSGYPLSARSKCTVANCLTSISQLSVSYLFPSWLLNAAFSAILSTNLCRTVSASLTIRRIVPPGVEVMRLEQMNDVDGMRRLFDLGLASPNDSLETGQTLLMVSCILILVISQKSYCF